MPLILKFETTTGRLVPGGIAPPIARAPQEVTLQFLTNSVAQLLPNGAPLALKLYAPDDLVHPLATFSQWTVNADFQLYTATINPLATELGWRQAGVLLGVIAYDASESPAFHVQFDANGEAVAAPITPIVITQPAGPVKITPLIGYFQGKLAVDQVEGRWVPNAPCELDGFDLRAQVDPAGQDVIIEAVVNNAAAGRTAILPAGAKGSYTQFATPLQLAAGDVVQFQANQIGSNARPGSYLTVSARGRLI